LEMNYWAALVALILISIACKVMARRQRHRLEVIHAEQNSLMAAFVRETNISKLEFEPHVLGLSPVMQTMIYLIADAIN